MKWKNQNGMKYEYKAVERKICLVKRIIAKAPKTAPSAVLEALLGEDKYFSYLLRSSSMEGVPLTNFIIGAFKKFIHKI